MDTKNDMATLVETDEQVKLSIHLIPYPFLYSKKYTTSHEQI